MEIFTKELIFVFQNKYTIHYEKQNKYTKQIF